MDLVTIGQRAKKASKELSKLSTIEKNELLRKMGDNLVVRMSEIIESNMLDIENAEKSGLSEGMIDRLMLDESRIMSMKEGIDKIISLEDPVGEISEMKTMPNGLKIGKKRVPIGVVGIIYESRPNVTVDAAALCIKSSNGLILRGGKEAINSNKMIVKIIRDTLFDLELDDNTVQLIEDLSYDVAKEFMKMNKYVDVLIPRGSQSLIQTVVQNSTVPVIETGIGNCHVFVDETADLEKALNIVINAKTQRIGVCNAMESLLVHEKAAAEFLPMLEKSMNDYKVTVKADSRSRSLSPTFEGASEEDWGKEYLDMMFSLKIVDSADEAIDHINKYGTGHSEAIITESYKNSMKFLDEVDAAAVYVNASTRFTDGFEFGMGAEMGISTQKLHARGPVGLKELTTTKYIIFGSGQTR